MSKNAYYEAVIKDGYKKGSDRVMEVIAPSKKAALCFFEARGEVLSVKKLNKEYYGSQATR